MVYRGKYCDLLIKKYYIKSEGIKFEWVIVDRNGTIIDANSGYDTRSGAKHVGRKRFYNREDELKAKAAEQINDSEGSNA